MNSQDRDYRGDKQKVSAAPWSTTNIELGRAYTSFKPLLAAFHPKESGVQSIYRGAERAGDKGGFVGALWAVGGDHGCSRHQRPGEQALAGLWVRDFRDVGEHGAVL